MAVNYCRTVDTIMYDHFKGGFWKVLFLRTKNVELGADDVCGGEMLMN